MRRKAVIAGFCALTLAVVLAPVARAQDDVTMGRGFGGNSPGGFGMKVAGAWLGTGSFDVDLGCDGVYEVFGVPVLDTHVFGADGTEVTTNPTSPMNNAATWKKTGTRQLTSRAVGFGVGFDGTPTSVFTIDLVVDFDRWFRTATTSFEARVYAVGEDPLDPANPPFVCTAGSHTGFRKVQP